MAMNRAMQRRLAFGSNATLVTVLVVATLVVGWLFADTYRVRLDLSSDQGSTLLPDTRNKLRLLDSDGEAVTITGFTAQRGKDDSRYKDQALSDLLEELDYTCMADWVASGDCSDQNAYSLTVNGVWDACPGF